MSPHTNGSLPAAITELIKLSLSQLMLALNYTQCQHTALDTLIDVYRNFICELGTESIVNANHAARAQINSIDVIHTLGESMDIDINELIEYIQSSDTITPYYHNTPYIPQSRSVIKLEPILDDSSIKVIDDNHSTHDILQQTESANTDTNSVVPNHSTAIHHSDRPPYIPPHLPRLPNKHEWSSTPIYTNKTVDPVIQRKRKLQQQNDITESIMKIQKHNQYNNDNFSNKQHDIDDALDDDINPFLTHQPIPTSSTNVSPQKTTHNPQRTSLQLNDLPDDDVDI